MEHPELLDVAKSVVNALRVSQSRIVFAESCTAGLLSATLSRIPGVSSYLCGSVVTYRNATKAAWLGVSEADLDDPKIGAVSEQVAKQMCEGVLKTTTEANIAASITGHLGPHAPEEQDGLVFIGIARTGQPTKVHRIVLRSKHADELELRHRRQNEAACSVLQLLEEALKQ